MVFLEPDCLVSLVTGVERKKGERDDDVPDVSGTAVDGHRVLVVPLVGEPRGAS